MRFSDTLTLIVHLRHSIGLELLAVSRCRRVRDRTPLLIASIVALELGLTLSSRGGLLLLLFLLLLSLLFHDVRIVVQSLVELQLLHLLAVFYFLILRNTIHSEFLTEEIIVSKLIVHRAFAEATYDGLEGGIDSLRVSRWLLIRLRCPGAPQCLALDIRYLWCLETICSLL